MNQYTTQKLVFFLVLLLTLLLVAGCGIESPDSTGTAAASTALSLDSTGTAIASAAASPDLIGLETISAAVSPDLIGLETIFATASPDLFGMETVSTAASPDSTGAPPTSDATSVPSDDDGGTTSDNFAAAVASRTPVPSPTPGIIDREIDDLTTSLGLTGETFLGLSVDDWFNLAFSVLVVVLGYFLGYKLLVWFLKWIAHRTSRKFNETVLKEIEPNLKLLLLVFFTRNAVLRLDFLSQGLRTALEDFFYIAGLVLVTIIAIQLINFYLYRIRNVKDEKGDRNRLDPALNAIQRISDLAVVIIAVSFGLSHFGISGSAIAAALLVSFVVIYMGTKDIISDVVAGYIILLDQPFRVGDAILIKHVDTWGTVTEIGARTTHIRTGDNREVIIPNSEINGSQVVNYTYPDPIYQMHTDIGIAYGSDITRVREVIEDTVGAVGDVLHDKPVQVYFLKFGDSARLMHVQFWINDFKNKNSVLDKVNAALEEALDQAGIDIPFNTDNLNVKMESEKTNQAVQDTNKDSQVDSN